MNLKERFLFRGFYEDPAGEQELYINGRKVRGRWLYGNLKLIAGDGDGFSCYIRSYGRRGHRWKVIPETVGCFAGLRAKGERIFEGDICRFYDGECGATDYIIRWSEKLCRFEAVWQENDVADDLDEFFAERAEIVGTIFGKENGYGFF